MFKIVDDVCSLCNMVDRNQNDVWWILVFTDILKIYSMYVRSISRKASLWFIFFGHELHWGFCRVHLVQQYFVHLSIYLILIVDLSGVILKATFIYCIFFHIYISFLNWKHCLYIECQLLHNSKSFLLSVVFACSNLELLFLIVWFFWKGFIVDDFF